MSDADRSTTNIECRCAGNLPQNGQTLVLCKGQCQMWFHVKCMLGEDFEFNDYAVNHYGYKCDPCRTAARRAAAKAGYAKRYRANSPAQSTGPSRANSSRSVQSKFKSAALVHDSPPERSGTNRHGSPQAPHAALSSVRKAKSEGHGRLNTTLSANADEKAFFASLTKAPNPQAAPRASAGQQAEVHDAKPTLGGKAETEGKGQLQNSPTTLADEKDFFASLAKGSVDATKSRVPGKIVSREPNAVPPTAAAITPRSKARDTAAITVADRSRVRQKPVDDPVLQWINSTDHPTVSCSCKGGPGGTFHEYMVCVRCPKVLHKGCMPSAAVDTIGQGKLCAECREIRLRKAHRNQLKMNMNARVARQKLLVRLQAGKKNRHEGLKRVVAEHFWKGYCDLPEGKSSPAVLELTSRYYDNGKMVPIHPAPASWVDEVVARVHALVCPANRELVNRVVGKDKTELDLMYPDKLRRGLGEVAVLKLHQGKPKGSKKELGVLAEVLGLEEKGTFWQG